MLNYAIQNGIINLSYVQDIVEMKRKEEILRKHPYKIWEGKNGKWYTYIYEDKRILKKRASRKSIEDFLVSYYEKKEKELTTEEKKIKKEQEILEYQFKNNFKLWEKKQESFGVSNNTLSKYQSDYTRYFKDTEFENMDIRNINEEDVKALVISNIKKYNLREKAGKALFGYINGVFHSAKINRKITENPCEFIDKRIFYKFYDNTVVPAEKRVLSEYEESELLNFIKKQYEEKPNYIPLYAVELALYTGMRVGELAALRWDRILYDKKIIVIDSSEKYDYIKKKYYIDTTKTHKIRYFPLTPVIIEFLKKIKQIEIEYGYLTEFVFSNEEGRVHSRVISKCMRSKSKQAGLDTKSISSIRRTVNSKMKCMGVPTTVAASMFGHSERVNNDNYSYDITNAEYKMEIVSKMNDQVKIS
jgi:integrase